MKYKADSQYMTEKRIAFYLPTLKVGGAERVSINLANEFAERGYTVDMVLAEEKGELIPQVSPHVDVVDLSSHGSLPSGVVPSVPYLANYLRKRNPDAVIAALTHSNLAAILAKSIAKTDTQIIVTEHLNTTQPSAKQLLAFKLAQHLYPQADDIISVSEGVNNSISSTTGIPAASMNVIYNPVVTKGLIDASKENINHPWFGSDTPVIVTLGRLASQKNHSLLLKSFSRLLKERDAKLIIIGTGELESELKQQASNLDIEDRVDFTGFIDNPYNYISNADVFALSSNKEGLPTVLIEALACGCPTVSTDCPSGPREILEGGKIGQLVEMNNPNQLANAIAREIDNPTNEDVLRNRATEFHVKSAVDNYEKILR